MKFTPDLVFIRDLETRQIIATRVVDHASRLYYFLDFGHDDDSDFQQILIAFPLMIQILRRTLAT